MFEKVMHRKARELNDAEDMESLFYLYHIVLQPNAWEHTMLSCGQSQEGYFSRVVECESHSYFSADPKR